MRNFFFILFFLCFKQILFCKSHTIPFGKDCSIYQIDNGQKVVYSNINGSRFNFGYLRVNKDTPPLESQVFIKFSNENNVSSQIEIYFNARRQIILRFDGAKKAESTKYLKNLTSLPSWYSFEVLFQDGEIKLIRPGEVTDFVKGKLRQFFLPDHKYEVSISSKNAEFVTFNCLTHCPVFDFIRGKSIIVELQTTFKLNLLCNGRKSTCFIKFNVSSSWFPSFSHTTFLSPEMEGDLVFKVGEEDGVKTLQIAFPEGGRNFTSQTNGTINYTLEISEAQNLFWSLNCKPDKSYLLSSSTTFRAGRAFPPQKPATKGHMTFRLGEVAAWIVASLSLCGLLIVGLTLYMKVVQQTEWTEDGEKIDPGASVSHVGGAVEMIPYPKVKNSTFYAEVRKPEETSGVQTDRSSINVISDFLYPLDLSIDDDADDDRLTSRDTVLTQITNVPR